MPTLRGLWSSPPYLHDGSAATIEDVLNSAAHGGRGTTSGSTTRAFYTHLPPFPNEAADTISMKPKLNERTLIHIVRQMVTSLAYLHSHDVFHRDVKPENFLLMPTEAYENDPEYYKEMPTFLSVEVEGCSCFVSLGCAR